MQATPSERLTCATCASCAPTTARQSAATTERPSRTRMAAHAARALATSTDAQQFLRTQRSSSTCCERGSAARARASSPSSTSASAPARPGGVEIPGARGATWQRSKGVSAACMNHCPTGRRGGWEGQRGARARQSRARAKFTSDINGGNVTAHLPLVDSMSTVARKSLTLLLSTWLLRIIGSANYNASFGRNVSFRRRYGLRRSMGA